METSGFFTAKLNNGVYDRTYAAEQFAKYFARFISNGVFLNVASNALMVEALPDEGMKIKINPGDAFIKGYWYCNDNVLKKNIEPADGTLKRVDTVVVRFYNEERKIQLDVVTGIPSNNPQMTPVVRNADYYEILLAKINLPQGATKIKSEYIVDMRLDTELCGAVGALVEQIDTTQYGAQLNNFIQLYIGKCDVEYAGWIDRLNEAYQSFLNLLDDKEDEFDEWFANVKGKLSQDVAGSLMNDINDLRGDVEQIGNDLARTAYLDVEETEAQDVEGMDADTLGGHHPSYFTPQNTFENHKNATSNANSAAHVFLSDSTTSTSDVSKGVAATPKAIKIVNDKIDEVKADIEEVIMQKSEAFDKRYSNLSSQVEVTEGNIRTEVNGYKNQVAGFVNTLNGYNNQLSSYDLHVQNYASQVSGFNSQVQGYASEVSELKKSVSDGKALVANAITNKEVSTATNSDYSVLAANIGKLYSASQVASARNAASASGAASKETEIKNKLVTALSAKYKSYDVISSNLSIDQLIGYINSLDGYDFSFSFNMGDFIDVCFGGNLDSFKSACVDSDTSIGDWVSTGWKTLAPSRGTFSIRFFISTLYEYLDAKGISIKAKYPTFKVMQNSGESLSKALDRAESIFNEKYGHMLFDARLTMPNNGFRYTMESSVYRYQSDIFFGAYGENIPSSKSYLTNHCESLANSDNSKYIYTSASFDCYMDTYSTSSGLYEIEVCPRLGFGIDGMNGNVPIHAKGAFRDLTLTGHIRDVSKYL